MNDKALAPDEDVDLTNCDREPIHIPSTIQPFGCLIACSHDWIVTHVSQNLDDVLGLSSEDLPGTLLTQYLTSEAVHEIRSRLQVLTGDDGIERLFQIPVIEGGGKFDVAVHLSGRNIVLEFEPSMPGRAGDQAAYVRPLISRLNKAASSSQLFDMAVRQVRALTGFDRVMMYRFAADDSGEVVAESHATGMEPFNGLRYPASDIPKQARALYLRSLLRIISDTDAEPVPIVPERNAHGQPLDMSLAGLRAVSPIHIEYLQNMGVGASMSISIIRGGKLWGLIACHHRKARVLSYEIRSAAEMFGQIFSFVLEQVLSNEERAQLGTSRAVHDRLMSSLSTSSDIGDNFETFTDAVAEVIEWDGAALSHGQHYTARGKAPTREAFLPLQRFLNTAASGTIYHTDNLKAVYPQAEDLGHDIAGLLAIPVSREPRDYIVLFRREIARSVRWAGNPNKPVTVGPNGARLTPRKSFETWQEVVRDTSAPWTAAEVQAAEGLRATLIEIILRLTDSARRDSTRAQERQELLIAELNHRVRNMLNLIRGLVKQSADTTTSVSDFTEVLGGRIHALARAHDQLTSDQWAPLPLSALIETEASGFLSNAAERVEFSGADPMLPPLAFSTLALMFHELMTNSSKYGALSVPGGRAIVEATEEDRGGVSFTWKERGGPPVQPPSRRGFGTAIVERSIPHELKGRAELHYHVGGVEAEFYLPGSQIAGFNRTDPSPRRADTPTVVPSTPDAPKIDRVLLVEDNMIIGLDAEDILRDLGAQDVQLVASNTAALELLDRREFDMAMLDVNLGTETSRLTAERLVEMGIPFIFATGYGETIGLTDVSEKPVPVVQKPFSNDSIGRAIAKLVWGE
ncbi:HWE histidine kinase domain-containing protein [Roseobacter sp. HKCCA0434]|uniref:HWE histidine kinase domain-containing protein n=1 Tax=Roseobacter sp. HKCCA0434 TaxID=3079297 RepID=UPI0029058E17|nr:HWE histidine kinase domain-containing protein [Roseobacter sp. HKCCA0434]